MSRLFHSLVVCGAGLTLTGCGGRYDSREPPESSETGSGSGAAAGGSSAGTGGAPPIMIGVGGGPALGGAPGVSGFTFGGTAPGAILADSQGQWSCDGRFSGCSDGFILGQQCVRDDSRPRSQADCAPGSVLSCLYGSLDSIPLLFNCECLPVAAEMCPCPDVVGGGCIHSGAPVTCSPERVVCGCAFTCITR
jgi:hypothetical protein